MDHLWIAFTLAAALAQTFRNATQTGLTGALGTAGATHVRFLFGAPFALLFLAISVAIWGVPPVFGGAALVPLVLGAIAQVAATAAMLAAMRARSFVVTTALVKTEPAQVALFGFVLLGDVMTLQGVAAIAIATTGVVLLATASGPSTQARPGLGSIVLGMGAGAGFALAAVGFRGAILALGDGPFALRAMSVLAGSLAFQAGAIALWLALFDRPSARAIAAAWRPSLGAGLLGAVASACWFLAFAVQSAAHVRTLALVELLFAGLVGRKLMGQMTRPREALAIILVVAGAALVINA